MPFSASASTAPGSAEAVTSGCLCDPELNMHGAGYLGQADVHAVSPDCPLHGLSPAFRKRRPEKSVPELNLVPPADTKLVA